MRLTLSRFLYRPDGIVGRLLDEQDQQLAITLEHAYDDAGGPGVPRPKMPAGTYRCRWGEFPTKGWAFEICDVPGHAAILIHAGNWETDSQGCVLVGDLFQESDRGIMVLNSWRALAKLLARLHTVTEFTLIVQDAPTHEAGKAAA